MMYKSALGVLALAAPLVSAVGQARVVNNCDFEATVWSVGSAVSEPNTLDAAGGEYSETFRRDPVTGGVSLKVTVEPDGLYTGAPQLNYAYSLDPGQIWYDLSSVFGDAFGGHRLVVGSAKETCPEIVWEDGTNPGGSQVKDCTSDEDVTLTLCA
jgi:hypothetical protein